MNDDEGDAPTAPDAPITAEQTTLAKMTALWVKIDGLAERAKQLLTPKGGAEVAQPAATESSASSGSSVNRITINLGGSTLIVVVMLASIIGACGIVMGIDIAERSVEERRFEDLQRQYRMTELKLDDWTVVAHRSGLVLPGDYTRGPQGNLDSESFTQPKGAK